MVLVHVYILGHIVAWYGLGLRPWGKTAMSGVPALLTGSINAAAVMVVVILLSLLFFGRAFCGWACHLRGAIELAHVVLLRSESYRRRSQRNELLNSRFHWPLRFLSLSVLLFPVVAVWLASGWGGFRWNPTESSPLADLPATTGGRLFYHLAPWNPEVGSGIIAVALGLAVTLGIVFALSFGLSWFFGHGAFCRILCPYSALFRIFLNRNPFQTKITRMEQCTGCRECSKTCPQGIDVSREIFFRDGKISNPDCIKCMKCVDVCEWNVLKDTSRPAVPQSRTLPYKNPEELQSLQRVNGMRIWVDVASLVAAVFTGAVAALFGAFFFFVGAAVGFTAVRWVGGKWLPPHA